MYVFSPAGNNAIVNCHKENGATKGRTVTVKTLAEGYFTKDGKDQVFL